MIPEGIIRSAYDPVYFNQQNKQCRSKLLSFLVYHAGLKPEGLPCLSNKQCSIWSIACFVIPKGLTFGRTLFIRAANKIRNC
jgi:hypothetical protein